MGLGQVIKYARTQLGLSQKELANLVGCAEITIRQYEADRREPSYDMCSKLEDALRIDLVAHGEDLLKKYGPAENFCPSLGDVPEQYAALEKEWATAANTSSGERLLNAFIKLNADGQVKAVERVEELSEIPKYQRSEEQENPPEPKE